MSKIKGRIKPPKQDESNSLKVHPEFRDSPEQRPPEFSLRYVQNAYCITNCQANEKVAFVDKLFRLSKLSWAQIKQVDRHSLGFEKLPRHSIKAGIPKHITDDVDLIAFRFCNKAPMVGYRREATFFILWFDRDFSLYDHG
ncbi:hypothetical protein H0I54_14625 [Yersinia kristensenii]|uniref:hypothetical protein n=1 Tax=Yersinia kristensenii TaxID=28152 RepID=UPI001C60C52B|nr:hypothetical protein [Yersinia kristensenii]MBW5843042.1 hypothetical protein [Yersinia kristensenii]MDA5489457.1 hypothetical protein [Yersinia kristensenii]